MYELSSKKFSTLASLPDGAIKKLIDWFGPDLADNSNYPQLLYAYTVMGCVVIAVIAERDGTLGMARLFSIGTLWEISIDETARLIDG